ncbi:MAG TPA: DUF222 domain-containing protein [Candidatus Dormibacteraeota bacterium]
MCRSSESPLDRIMAGLRDMPGWIAKQPAGQLGQVIIKSREIIDRTEAMAADATRRFEKAGGYKADGFVDMVAWLRVNGKLSGGAAAERVEVAHQLNELPRTEEALARGEIGYQHAVTMARTAQTVGAAQVRKAEGTLLQAAETMDPGQFLGVAKNFEHQVDAQAALAEANRAHARRYLRIGPPLNGLVRIDGLLDAEGGAIVRTALEPFAKPTKGDTRTPDQRLVDALVTHCRRGAGQGHPDGAGPRPQLIIKADLDTLAGIDGAPAGELEWGGTVPAETVRRFACDGAITRITGLGELDQEITHAARSIPPATRRALVVRDHHCVFPGCDRPAPWCDGHHLIHWADGGPTKLDNLGLVCGAHHRKVHEEGWKLRREKDGRWIATPPRLTVIARARTG